MVKNVREKFRQKFYHRTRQLRRERYINPSRGKVTAINSGIDSTDELQYWPKAYIHTRAISETPSREEREKLRDVQRIQSDETTSCDWHSSIVTINCHRPFVAYPRKRGPLTRTITAPLFLGGNSSRARGHCSFLFSSFKGQIMVGEADHIFALYGSHGL